MSLLAQDERLTRRVGAIALCLIAFAIGFVVFLWDRIEIGSPVRITLYLTHTAGLHEKAPIVVAGRAVGHIETIAPVSHGAKRMLQGKVGVAITVALDDDQAWKVPLAAEVFVASRGPLSDKYLEVAPPEGDPGPAVKEGDELRGVDPPSLDNVLQHTFANVTTFQLFAADIAPEGEAFRTQLAALRKNLDDIARDTSALPAGLATEVRGLVDEARTLYAQGLGGEPGVAKLGATVAQARVTFARLRATLDLLGPKAAALGDQIDRIRDHVAASDPAAKVAATIDRVRATLDALEPLMAKLEEINQRIARGEGSLGRLANDPEFPEDAKDLGKIMKRQPWKIIAHPKD